MEHKRLRERHALLRETGLALSVATGPDRDRGVSPHTHDVVEVYCVRRGRGAATNDGRRRRLRPGTVGIVHHDQAHGYEGDTLELVNLFLDLGRLALPDIGELQSALHAILPWHPSPCYTRQPPLHLDLPARGGHLAVLDAMLAEQRDAAAGHRQALLAHLRVFLIHLARRADAAGLHGDGRAWDTPPAAVERVRRHLERHWDRPLRLDDLAELAGWAPATLARRFRRYTGETVLGYAQRLRIQAACQALAACDDPVTEIAQACAFADQSFFNRVFRRTTGMTPTQWRRRALGSAPAHDGGGSAGGAGLAR